MCTPISSVLLVWVCPQGKLKKMKTDSGEGESPLPGKPQPNKKGAKKTPPSKQVKTAQSKAVMVCECTVICPSY